MKNLIIIILALLISACAVQQQQVNIQPQPKPKVVTDWKMMKSLSLFSFYDYEMFQGNYSEALKLLQLAEMNNPQSIILKEKIIDLLAVSSYNDSLVTQMMVDYGKKWYAEGRVNSKILYHVGKACIETGDIDIAGRFLRESLNEDPQVVYFFDYFLYQENYDPPADTALLGSVLDMEWEDYDEEYIYRISNAFEFSGNYEQSREFLIRAYHKWGTDLAMQNILALNENLNDMETSFDLIQKELLNGNEIPYKFVGYAVHHMLKMEQYERIANIHEQLLEYQDEFLSFSVLFAFEELGKIDELNIISQRILTEDYMSTDGRVKLISNLVLNNIKSEEYGKAVDTYDMIDDIMEKIDLAFYYYHKCETQECIDAFGSFLELYFQETDNKNDALIMLIIFNLNEGYAERIPELVSLIDNDVLLQDKVLAVIAAAIKNTIEDLEAYDFSYIDNKLAGNGIFLGHFYYHLNLIERAYQVYDLQWMQRDMDKESVWRFAEILYDKQQTDKAITVYEWGMENYSDSSSILNMFGYGIAKNGLEEYYPQAEQALQRALEISPKNRSIWDSLGWLYYKMGNYHQAETAMMNAYDEEWQNGVISFHYGAVLYKTGNIEKAYQMLIEAQETGLDEEESIPDLEKLIDEIKDKYLEE